MWFPGVDRSLGIRDSVGIGRSGLVRVGAVVITSVMGLVVRIVTRIGVRVGLLRQGYLGPAGAAVLPHM